MFISIMVARQRTGAKSRSKNGKKRLSRVLFAIRSHKKTSSLAVALFAALIGGGIFASTRMAGAIGSTYFDDTDTVPANVRIDEAVGQTYYVRQTAVQLKAYFTQSSGQVVVHQANYCPADSGGGDLIQNGDAFNGNNIPAGTPITHFRFSGGTAQSSDVSMSNNAFDGVYVKSASNAKCGADYTVNLSGLSSDPEGSGYFVATITVNHIDQFAGVSDGIQNDFFFHAAGPGAQIAHAAGSTGYDVTAQQVKHTPANTDYHIKFGSDCSVTSPRQVTMEFYDIDNDGGGGAQQGGKIWMDLYESDAGGGPRTQIPINNYVNNTQSNPLAWYPPTNNNVATPGTFTAKPEKRYELVIHNVYYNNTIQFGMPFDGIFYEVSCGGGLGGRINTSPSTDPVENGTPVTFSAESYKTGNVNFDSHFHFTFRGWYDSGDGKYEAGSDQQKCLTSADRDETGAGPMALASCVMTADTAQAGGHATQICTQLIITALEDRSKVDPSVAPPDGLTKCVQIGKAPHMEARNGDVLAGGVFASVDPTCKLTNKPIVDSSQRRIPVGGPYYTSYATYGVTSLGASNKFGSMGLSYDGAANSIADDLIFSNQGSSDGYFYNTTAQGTSFPGNLNHCLNDPFSIFSASSITNSNSGATVDLSSLSANTVLTSTSTISVYASRPIPAGTKIVVYAPNADIKIASNITYQDGRYASLNSIPQLILLTNQNIVIQENAKGGALSTNGKVTELDGLYAAKRSIYTCDLIPRLHVCETPLTINGAVLAGVNLVPLRTAGADAPDYGAMAETFNLRPDVLESQLPEAGNPSTFLQTMSETEAPARF